MIKCALYGIEGVYNFGCEAIVRGLEKLIHTNYADAEITYYSRNAEQDSRMLKDCNITVTDCRLQKSVLRQTVNKIFRLLNSETRLPLDEYNTIINNADIIYSIGGDIYTIPKYKLDKKKQVKYNKLVSFGELALKKKKTLVILGASIGPFGENKNITSYYFCHLIKVSRIYCREYVSQKYLSENGIEKNVSFLPDPAFSLAKRDVLYDKDGYIVLNLSPLSFLSSTGTSEGSIDKCAELASEIYRNTGKKVVLVPHVISPVNPKDNDMLLLQNVYAALSDDIKPHVELVNPDDLSFLRAKAYLQNASLVVAARMHCAVNAISETIPTVLLSYSSKAIGMAKFVYNNSDHVIGCNESVNTIMNTILKTYTDRTAIHDRLQVTMENTERTFSEFRLIDDVNSYKIGV